MTNENATSPADLEYLARQSAHLDDTIRELRARAVQELTVEQIAELDRFGESMAAIRRRLFSRWTVARLTSRTR